MRRQNNTIAGYARSHERLLPPLPAASLPGGPAALSLPEVSMKRSLCFLAVAALGLALHTLCAPLAAAVDPSLLAGMEARSIGPAAMSGRIAAIASSSAHP